MKNQIIDEIKNSINVKNLVLNDLNIISKIELLVKKSIESLNNGGK